MKNPDRSQGTVKHIYKQSTEEIISKVNCPHRVFAQGGSADDVNEAYREAAVRGREEGFVPILVQSDETLAEWLGILEDESYSKEAVLRQEKMDAWALLQVWLDENMEMGEDESWGEGETPEEFMEEAEVIDCLTSFVGYSGYGIEETILFEIPVKNPWEVIAWMPMGGWNECPAVSEMMEVCRYWYEKYGAVPAAFSHDTIEFMLDRPVDNKETAYQLAREHYAFCPDRVDQGTATGTIGEVAECIRLSKVWFFWWD